MSKYKVGDKVWFVGHKEHGMDEYCYINQGTIIRIDNIKAVIQASDEAYHDAYVAILEHLYDSLDDAFDAATTNCTPSH